MRRHKRFINDYLVELKIPVFFLIYRSDCLKVYLNSFVPLLKYESIRVSRAPKFHYGRGLLTLDWYSRGH